jgi:hypothetical protein
MATKLEQQEVGIALSDEINRLGGGVDKLYTIREYAKGVGNDDLISAADMFVGLMGLRINSGLAGYYFGALGVSTATASAAVNAHQNKFGLDDVAGIAGATIGRANAVGPVLQLAGVIAKLTNAADREATVVWTRKLGLEGATVSGGELDIEGNLKAINFSRPNDSSIQINREDPSGDILTENKFKRPDGNGQMEEVIVRSRRASPPSSLSPEQIETVTPQLIDLAIEVPVPQLDFEEEPTGATKKKIIEGAQLIGSTFGSTIGGMFAAKKEFNRLRQLRF